MITGIITTVTSTIIALLLVAIYRKIGKFIREHDESHAKLERAGMVTLQDHTYKQVFV